MKPEPVKFDKKHQESIARATETIVNNEAHNNTFYANLCCVGLLSKLMPETLENDHSYRKNTVENAMKTCKCPEESSMLSKACHGDLYFVGLLWISAMKTALLGFDVFPSVEAAQPPPPPEEPPKMPYKELPLYDTPHKDYREAKEATKPMCPEAKQQLLLNYLLPTVSTARKKVSDVYYQNKCLARNFLIDQGKCLEKKYNEFVKFMRNPNKMPYRIGAVALTSLIGLKLGWRGGIPRKVLFTSLGALAGGALAFPEETDQAFRNVMFHTGNVLFVFYNLFYGTCESMPVEKPCPKPLKERPDCQAKEDAKKDAKKDGSSSIFPEKQVPCPLDPPPKK